MSNSHPRVESEPTQFIFTKEIVNGLRLFLLIASGGQVALNKCIDEIVKKRKLPSDFLDVGYISNLGIPLNHHQRQQLQSGEVDISLLLAVLRSLEDDVPRVGWNNLPNDSDTSRAADVARIGYYRNWFFHRGSIKLPDDEFQKLWDEISDALTRRGVSRDFIEQLNIFKYEANMHDTPEKVSKQTETRDDCEVLLDLCDHFVKHCEQKLMELFYESHPSECPLSELLKQHRCQLQDLEKQGKISSTDFQALFPDDEAEQSAIEKFSFSLLHSLVQHTCKLDEEGQKKLDGLIKSRDEMLLSCLKPEVNSSAGERLKWFAKELLHLYDEKAARTKAAGKANHHSYRKGQVLETKDEEVEFRDLTSESKQKLPWKIMEDAKMFIGGCLNAALKGTIYYGVDDEGKVLGLQLGTCDKKNIRKSLGTTLECHIIGDECPMSIAGDQRCINLDFVPVEAHIPDLYVVQIGVVRKWEYCKDRIYYDVKWKEKRCSEDISGTNLQHFEVLGDFYEFDRSSYENAAVRTRGETKRFPKTRQKTQILEPLQSMYQEWQDGGDCPVYDPFTQHDSVAFDVDLDRNESGGNGYQIKTGSPTLEELQNLATKVMDIWARFARALLIPEAIITEIKYDEQHSVYERSYRMLRRWKEVKSSSATYEALVRGLQHPSIGWHGLAYDFCVKNYIKDTSEEKYFYQMQAPLKGQQRNTEESKEGQTKRSEFVSGFKDLSKVSTRYPYRSIALSVSQNTALENSQDGSVPANDGTNSCSFLCILIAHNFLTQEEFATATGVSWKRFATMVEGIIQQGPIRFNSLREKQRHYDVSEAYSKLRNGNIIDEEYEFTEELVEQHPALSDDGLKLLATALTRITEQSCNSPSVAMYTCGGYMFLIGCTTTKQLFVVDTHSVSADLGGTGNGLLIIMEVGHPHQADQLCDWIVKRLVRSGVSINGQEKQSLAVMSISEFRSPNSDCSSCGVDTQAEPKQGVAIENSFNEIDDTSLEGQDKDLRTAVAKAQLEFIAEGGQGTVYKASGLKLPNGDVADAAVKIINKKGKAFKREEKVKNLRNPYIVPVWNLYRNLQLEHLQLDDGLPDVAVYPFMVNGDLYNNLFERKQMDGDPLYWRTRIKIAAQMLFGLCYLHVNNFILRDVKSSNVLLDRMNNARICDYGLVKEFGDDVNNSSGPVTVVEMTRGYTCPEYRSLLEVEGSDVTVKPAHDQYGFGVVLLELLTELPAKDKKTSSSLTHRLQFSEHVMKGNFLDDSSVSKSVAAILENSEAATNMKNIGWPEDVKKKIAELAVGCLFHDSAKRIELECLYEEVKKLVMTYPEKEVAHDETKQCNNCLALHSYGGYELPCSNCHRLLTFFQDPGDCKCLLCCCGKRGSYIAVW